MGHEIFVQCMGNRICDDAFVFPREDDGNDFDQMLTVSNGGGIFCRFSLRVSLRLGSSSTRVSDEVLM